MTPPRFYRRSDWAFLAFLLVVIVMILWGVR